MQRTHYLEKVDSFFFLSLKIRFSMATLNIQIHQLFLKLGLIPLHGKILCPTSEELLNLDHAYLWIHAKALYQEQI